MLWASRFVQRLAGLQVGAGSKMSLRSIRSARHGNHAIGNASILHCLFSYDRPDAQIVVGDRCFIGKSHLISAERILIGDDVIISWGVTIVDHNSHTLTWIQRKADIANWHLGKKDWAGIGIAPVNIEDKVWIGFNAIILKGVTIGEGAIVGAGAVVTKDVQPFSVVAGNPATVARQLERSDA